MIEDYFLIKPSISGGFSISDIWNTNVQSRPVGNEVRSQLFSWPRVTISQQCLLTDHRAVAWCFGHIWKNISKVWGCPIWIDKTYLTTQASSGQPILTVDNYEERRFYEGSLCLIVDANDPYTYEEGRILTLDSSEITLTDNLTSTWDAGSFVYPLISCRISSIQDFKYIDDKSLYIDIEFAQSVAEDDYLNSISFTQSVQQYLDYDVFDHSPSINSPTIRIFKNFEVLENLGVSYSLDKEEEAQFILTHKYVKEGRTDIWEILKFFGSKKGMFSPFWLPSFRKDFEITDTFISTDTVIEVSDTEYVTLWFPNDINGRYVYFKFIDGTLILKSISGATASSVTLDSAIGKTCTDLSTVKMGFLYFVRFNQDEIKIDYSNGTNEVADIDLTFKTLSLEAPEI